jgi:hypothetical protein
VPGEPADVGGGISEPHGVHRPERADVRAPADEDNAGYCPGDDPQASGGDSGSAPDVTMTRQTDKVVFKVSGSSYPSIQYGTDSDNNSPKGGYRTLGDGNVLPWSASMTYDPNALYYAVSA